MLEADLAFGRDSATVSSAARDAVVRLARRARKAGLQGTIRVDGYTDNLGSAAHGLELSQQRAEAVAGILRAELGRTALGVVARGHGEAGAPFSNATEAGRARNRRVTITLPPG